MPGEEVITVVPVAAVAVAVTAAVAAVEEVYFAVVMEVRRTVPAVHRERAAMGVSAGVAVRPLTAMMPELGVREVEPPAKMAEDIEVRVKVVKVALKVRVAVAEPEVVHVMQIMVQEEEGAVEAAGPNPAVRTLNIPRESKPAMEKSKSQHPLIYLAYTTRNPLPTSSRILNLDLPGVPTAAMRKMPVTR